MFTVDTSQEGIALINVTLPEGRTQQELVDSIEAEFGLGGIEVQCFGRIVRLNGRLTTAMALHLGHKLAHISKGVEIFDPKENSYVRAIWH